MVESSDPIQNLFTLAGQKEQAGQFDTAYTLYKDVGTKCMSQISNNPQMGAEKKTALRNLANKAVF